MRLYPLLACFTAGIAVGLQGCTPLLVAGAGLLAALALYVLAVWKTSTPSASFRHTPMRTAGLLLLSAFTGLNVAVCHPETPSGTKAAFEEWRAGVDNAATLRAVIAAMNTSEYGDRAMVRLEHPAQWRNHEVWIHLPAMRSKPGDRIEFPAGAMRKGARYPDSLFSIRHTDRAPVTGERFATAFIDRSGLGGQTKGFLRTLLTGDSRGVDLRSRAALADGGVGHMLALSGMHVGVVTALCMFLLWPLRCCGWWKLQTLLSLCGVWAFVAMCGSVSSLRAGLMLTFCCVAMISERRRDTSNALAASALVILLLSPSALTDAGFQLSFLSVAALVAFCGPLNPVSRRDHPLTFKVFGIFLIPLVAVGATWIVGAWYFGRVPVAFLPLNLVAVPLLAPYMLMAVVYLAVCGTPLHMDWLEKSVDAGPRLLCEAASVVSEGTVVEFSPSQYMLIGWLALLCVAGWWLNHRKTPD